MGDDPSVLPATFFDRDTMAVARDLLGKILRVRDGPRWRSGRIVETEAYVADDPANHAYRGRTEGNRSMFQGPGTLYVYPIHGVHCANLVTREGEAVLIRALEPAGTLEEATDGPGKLCRALGITRDRHDGAPVPGVDVQVVDDGWVPEAVGTSPRIGVTKAKERPLRFYVVGSAFLSR